jgi:hypothetical protein
MPRFDAFLGPSNTAVSPNITSELTMNWIPERNPISVNDMGTNVTDKNVRCSLIRTPGLATFVTLPKSPVRGVFPGDTRLFAAAGDSFYEVFADRTYVDRSIPGFTGSSGVGPAGGTIGNNGLPVQGFFNGTQILLISAGQAYIDNGNGPVPCQFSDPLFDLLVDPADATGKTLTTPTGGMFDASDVGKTVQITDGGGFNFISQPILSVNSSGGALGASAWGIPGSGLGVGIEWLGAISFSDLQLVTPSIVHSPSRVFGPSDIGLQLTVTSGTGWTPGTYTITGLVFDATGTPTGDAILSPNAGTAGATGGVGSIPSMMVTASQGAFLDGYFFVAPYPPTKTVYFSQINKGEFWNPLDFFIKGNYPDNVAALFADHQELYTMGDLESTQVWRDVGNADNPFAPDPGAVMHLGCQAPFSVVRLGNGVAWLGEDVRRGTRKAYHATGYNPVVVSTPGVEAQWAQYSSVSDAVAFVMMDQGHECWIINFPSANATWAYDTQTGWWHQRGYWDQTIEWWDRIRVWVHCVVALGGGREQHYGGDWENGKIYIMSTQYKTDDGWPMIRRRLAPHMTVENQRRFYARFEIDCDRLGAQRVFWNRLGNGRDRIWLMDCIQNSEAGGATLILGFSDDRAQTFHRMFSQSLDPTVDVSLANAYLKYADATWN